MLLGGGGIAGGLAYLGPMPQKERINGLSRVAPRASPRNSPQPVPSPEASLGIASTCPGTSRVPTETRGPGGTASDEPVRLRRVGWLSLAIDSHVDSGPSQASTHQRPFGPRSARRSRLAVAVDLTIILVSFEHKGSVQGIAHRSPDALSLWGAYPLSKVLRALN